MDHTCPKLFRLNLGGAFLAVIANSVEEARALILERHAKRGLTAAAVEPVELVDGPVCGVYSGERPERGRFPLSDLLYQHSPSLSAALPKWEAAMGSCFHFEVAVRLLANKHFRGESVIREIGDKHGQPGLVSMLIKKLAFATKEEAFLRQTNTMRNKLIHCEPDGLLKAIQKLEPAFDPAARVKELRFADGASGAEMLDQLQTMKGATNVKGTSSRDRGFFGWMLEAASNGTFEAAMLAFGEAIRIVQAKVQSPAAPAEPSTTP